MVRILGIDPGLNNTGWGIVQIINYNISFVSSGIIKTNSRSPMVERLNQIYQDLIKVIEIYQPNECAIEETFVNINPQSSLKLGHARGVVMLAAALSKLHIREYAATLIKKTIVGTGRAEKNQVKIMVKHLLPHAIISSDDAADALAVAICHYGLRKTLK